MKNFAFVKTTELTESKTQVLTQEQKNAIDEGLNSIQEVGTLSNEQVLEKTKKRHYPAKCVN